MKTSDGRKSQSFAAALFNMPTRPNGGVQLQGWDKRNYSHTTCKAAAPPEGQAEMLFATDSVHSGRRDRFILPGPDTLGPGGPANGSVFFLIRTSKVAHRDIDATNGQFSCTRGFVQGDRASHHYPA